MRASRIGSRPTTPPRCSGRARTRRWWTRCACCRRAMNWEGNAMRSSASVLMLVENNAYPLDVRVRREAHALHDAGYRVTVIAPRAPGQRWREDVDGIVTYRYPAPP